MSEKLLAALKVGPATTELREFDLPDLPPDAALLKVEVAGVCGTDVSQYKLPLRGAPLIMGHENVGTLARVGRLFAKHKGFKEGDLVFLEHYLPCGHCEWDHMGEYRHCAATEWFYDPKAIRYGYTAIDIAPRAVGRLQPLRLSAAECRAAQGSEGLSPEEAGIATPMSNGIQWTLFDGGVGYASDGAHSGSGPAGTVLPDGREVGRAPTASSSPARPRTHGGSRSRSAWRRRGDRRAAGRSARTDASRSPAGAASTSSSIARRALAEHRCCSGSKPPSGAAARWWSG